MAAKNHANQSQAVPQADFHFYGRGRIPKMIPESKQMLCLVSRLIFLFLSLSFS
jgi:hypothetical protein